jgi:hypothetical protein
MPAILRCPSCPICHAWIAPRATACPACRAERKSRHGMSLQGFQVYASLLLFCSAVVMAFALRIAAAPWLPTGEPPEYALWLLRASEAKPPPACRITVRDLSGREVVVTTPDSCEGAAAPRLTQAAVGPSTNPEHMALLRLLASGLHSVLALSMGGLVTWGLRNGLRRTFRRPAGFAWVSRARA